MCYYKNKKRGGAMMGYYGYNYYDPTIIFILLGVVISLLATINIRLTFFRFKRKKFKKRIYSKRSGRNDFAQCRNLWC